MPPVRILDNMQLEPNEYRIKIKEVDAGRGQIFASQLMVMDPMGRDINLPGVHTTEPTFGLPATWIEPALRDEAELRGYSIIDPSTVISTHLTEVLKANVSDLLSYANVQSLLGGLTKDQQKLVEDIVPGQISVSGIQRVLQVLLSERISIRDLPTILDGIAEVAGPGRTAQMIAEHVRSRLARQLCAANLGPDGNLPLLTLSPQWERDFAEAMIGDGPDRHLAMAPSRLQQFIIGVQGVQSAAQQGELPVLITSPSIRPHVRAIIERFRPQTVVMSQNEVHPRVRLKTIGSVSAQRRSGAADGTGGGAGHYRGASIPPVTHEAVFLRPLRPCALLRERGSRALRASAGLRARSQRPRLARKRRRRRLARAAPAGPALPLLRQCRTGRVQLADRCGDGAKLLPGLPP